MTDVAHEPIHPGESLLEDFLTPLGITRYRLAKAIGVTPSHIGDICAGRRRITPETAVLISRALGLTDGYWITAQAQYDLEMERDLHADRIAATPILVSA